MENKLTFQNFKLYQFAFRLTSCFPAFLFLDLKHGGKSHFSNDYKHLPCDLVHSSPLKGSEEGNNSAITRKIMLK